MKARSGDFYMVTFDRIKWLVAACLLLAGIVLNHFYSDILWSFRLLAWSLLAIALIFLGWRTEQGRAAVVFFKEARVELRKVFWPTKQETLQVTSMVLVVVAVLALILWGMDGSLMWLMGWLTGQRG